MYQLFSYAMPLLSPLHLQTCTWLIALSSLPQSFTAEVIRTSFQPYCTCMASLQDCKGCWQPQDAPVYMNISSHRRSNPLVSPATKWKSSLTSCSSLPSYKVENLSHLSLNSLPSYHVKNFSHSRVCVQLPRGELLLPLAQECPVTTRIASLTSTERTLLSQRSQHLTAVSNQLRICNSPSCRNPPTCSKLSTMTTNITIEPRWRFTHVIIIIIIIIIIIQRGRQCKVGREWSTPYPSKDPSIPTYRQKEEKGENSRNKNGTKQLRPTKKHWQCSWKIVPHGHWEGTKGPAVVWGSAARRRISKLMCDQSTSSNPHRPIR